MGGDGCERLPSEIKVQDGGRWQGGSGVRDFAKNGSVIGCKRLQGEMGCMVSDGDSMEDGSMRDGCMRIGSVRNGGKVLGGQQCEMTV